MASELRSGDRQKTHGGLNAVLEGPWSSTGTLTRLGAIQWFYQSVVQSS